MNPTAPSPRLVISALPKVRPADLGRELGVEVPETLTKDAQLDALLPSLPPRGDLVGRPGRDELRAVCRALSLDDHARVGAELAARILGTTPEALVPTRPRRLPGAQPRKGHIVRARHRQYLVGEVIPASNPGELACAAKACSDSLFCSRAVRDDGIVRGAIGLT